MLSHTSIHPQVFAALTQLSSIYHGIRTLSQNPLDRRGHRTKSADPASCTESTSTESAPLPLPCEADISRILSAVAPTGLNPILLPLATSGSSDAPWRQTHVSANSFFENKNGFPERHLTTDFQALTTGFERILGRRNVQRLLLQSYYTAVSQPVRGFKTERADKSHGIGAEKTSMIDDLKSSMFSKLFAVEKESLQTSKFQKLYGAAQEANPELQEKLKIAFAEGYQANQKTDRVALKTTLLTKTLRIFLFLLLAWLFVQVVQIFTAVGGGVRGFGVLNRDQFEVNPEEISVTFNDVKGADEAKQELQDIVQFLSDPEKFTSLGAKLPKGVLLVGPPGIGKTLLARAVAGEAGVPFFHASGSEFDEIFVGTGAKRVRQMFASAKMRAPCVIFIDEIDSVGAKRTSSQIHPYANQTINQLLSEMDGFTQNEGVIVLGATNRKDNLDQALLRPGRFDVEVRVFPPDVKGRKDILELYLSKVKFDESVDISKLAHGTTGFTGADLENMVNQAALKAAMDEADTVSMEHMEFARDKVLMGPAKMSKVIDKETNLLTAYHEAGHTLVAHFTRDAIPLHKVTIIPRGMSLGHTAFIEDKEVFNKTKSQLNAQMDIAMGGRVAEEIVYGADKVTTGASDDFKMATQIATAMVKQFGMSEKIGQRVLDSSEFDSGLSMVKVNDISPTLQELVDSEIKRMLQESYERARKILQNHSSEHRALAQALMEYETLNKQEIATIIEGKKLPRSL
ncbi:ATP-dependent zinc metalloprotease YME1L-like [Gigantopelta aegis]|uniref:ATP-dependent zinc metalloprotease YME1L-like n=1 Tax=Gigantopelta aegis TaxID=1735272 RepID=UPI001B888513|nr:ATP-dependent zinc metalloprotease YME1L-like [Gigantopelta aegis]